MVDRTSPGIGVVEIAIVCCVNSIIFYSHESRFFPLFLCLDEIHNA